MLSRLGFAFRQSSRKLFVYAHPDFAGTDDARSTKSEATNDGGIEWVTDYKAKILEKKISWTSKLTVYQPVFYSGKKALEDLAPEFLAENRIDSDVEKLSTMVSTDWENIFTSQITKMISVNLYTRWVYDAYDNSVKPLPLDEGHLSNPLDVLKAIRKSGQFKETLGINIVYRFL